MKTTQMRFFAKYLLIGCIIGLLIGFFIGRSTIDSTPRVKYVKGETVYRNISRLIPFKETVPEEPILPTDPITTLVDTAAIIKDWISKKDFKETLFNDQNGKLDLGFSVQYNQPFDLHYKFTPIQKQSTIYETKIWQPFISGSYNSFNQISVGVGMFYHNLGIEANYITDFNRKGVGIGLKYKF